MWKISEPYWSVMKETPFFLIQSIALGIVGCKVFSILNHQQDAYESLLKIWDMLHNHTKIDLFLGFAFSQEAMKYSSIIRNTFYGIINSTHKYTACKWVTTTSSNLFMWAWKWHRHSVWYIYFTKFCYLCNSSKHTNQNVIIQQPLITTICVNRFNQSRTKQEHIIHAV